MGVTITLALAVWFASSLIEYKIVSNSPHLKHLFNGIPGILISIAIGAFVGWSVGAAGGAGFILGQLLGLATNDFTFAMWSRFFKTGEQIKEVKTKVETFKTEHPTTFDQCKDGFRLLLKTIGMFCFAVVWVFGIPSRINTFIHKATAKLHLTKAVQ